MTCINEIYLDSQLCVQLVKNLCSYIECAPTVQRMEFTLVIQLADQLASSQLYKLAIVISSYIQLLYNGWHYSYTCITQLYIYLIAVYSKHLNYLASSNNYSYCGYLLGIVMYGQLLQLQIFQYLIIIRIVKNSS